VQACKSCRARRHVARACRKMAGQDDSRLGRNRCFSVQKTAYGLIARRRKIRRFACKVTYKWLQIAGHGNAGMERRFGFKTRAIASAEEHTGNIDQSLHVGQRKPIGKIRSGFWCRRKLLRYPVPQLLPDSRGHAHSNNERLRSHRHGEKWRSCRQH
jgi:hypothetical protein